MRGLVLERAAFPTFGSALGLMAKIEQNHLLGLIPSGPMCNRART